MPWRNGVLRATPAGHPIDVDINTFESARRRSLRRPTPATINIGAAHLAIANDITKQVSVFDGGRLGTIPTSMGRSGFRRRRRQDLLLVDPARRTSWTRARSSP